MNYKDRLNKIRATFGLEVKLKADKLMDGTAVEAEAFEAGYPLFIINADGTQSPAPAGKHETESGNIVEVDETGTIVSISAKSDEVNTEAVDAAEDTTTETEVEVETEKPVEDGSKEAIGAILDELQKLIAEITSMKEKMSKMETNYEAFAKAPGAEKAPRVTNAEGGKIDPIQSRIDALQALKKENFFK